MRKSNITVNAIEKTITVSRSFYKKASNYGTNEYKELRKAMRDNPDFTIEFKKVQKKTSNGLDFSRMADYIKTQPNSDERLAEFEEIKTIASAKGSLYPLTKKWFLETYPEYKESTLKITSNSAALKADTNANVNAA